MLNSEKENLFKLQVFQQTISTLCMYPLRIYKNSCYKEFGKEINSNNDLEKLHDLLGLSKPISFEKVISYLKIKIKEEAQSVDEESDIYILLESYAEQLREYMWETHPSNSLTFTREVKENRRLWLFLMLYDLFPKKFIDQNFQEPYFSRCLIDMQSIYVKLNDKYTLSIGRLFTKGQSSRYIVENIIKNYEFNHLNIFELVNLSKRKRSIELSKIEKEVVFIHKAFQLFLEIQNELPNNLDKSELENIALFIFMLNKDKQLTRRSLDTGTLLLTYSSGKLEFSKNTIPQSDSEVFNDVLEQFEINRDYFRDEYILRLKNTLSKKYTGLRNSDSFRPIEELLKHITSKLNADGASFVKYDLADSKLTLEAINGDAEYTKGIKRIVGQINRKEPHTFKKSRVLKVVNNYYNDDYKYDTDQLILKNLNANKILQPVKGKSILSNIAIPLTLQHKLLGVLLIDSFRANSFTKDDMNLIFSISNFLSVQIFDQIVENNLSSIMENLPEKAELDDETINEYFQKLARNINSIFFSYGVAIWKYSEDEVFTLKSTTLDMRNTKIITIDVSSGELISDIINKFQNEAFEYVEDYDIKNSSRLKSCNPVKYNKHIHCLHIYPIVRAGKLMGAFSVYNHSKDDYRAIDAKSLYIVKKHLIIFFNTMAVMKAQRALTKTEALHEIHARFNMVENKIIQLKSLVTEDFKELDYYARYRFMIKLEDINNLISNTRISFNYISSIKKVRRKINHVDDEITNLYAPLFTQKKEFNNVRHIFNELTNAIPYPYNCKNISINNTINVDISLEVHNLILSDIFQNILLNAVKYSFQGTSIRIFSKEKRHSLSIFIKNDGLPIYEEEEIDIFKYGYRGFKTKDYKESIDGKEVNYIKQDKENLGIGLYKSNQLVKKILTGEINLSREKSTLKGAEVNTFEILFPKKLLKKREK